MIIIYQNNFLYTTKFHTPITEDDIIKRTRLLEVLSHFRKYKLILLTAPAGYGKTALLASWKNHNWGEMPPIICWLNLEAGDNDETIFYSNLFYAFYENPAIPRQMKEAAVRLFGGCAFFKKHHLMYVINDMAKLKQEIIIVADNFQFISNLNIMQTLQLLMENIPRNLHIVLSGRNMPDMGLAKHRIYGKILDINEEELAFTYEETTSYCRHILGKDCYNGQLDDVFRQTEGWPVGIQIMTLSIKSDNNQKYLSEYMLGRKELISNQKRQILYDYLMEEVFGSLKEDYKKFLIFTSQPEYFTVPLCNFLLNIENGNEIIKDIKSKKIFLYCTDEPVEWYRYHMIFREFLHKQFLLQEEAVRLKLYEQLIMWYEEKEQWNEAINFAIKSKEYAKAVKLIEKISSNLGYRGEAHLLYKWNKLLPMEFVEKSPRLLLNSAWAASAEGRSEIVPIYIKKLSSFTVTTEIKNEMAALASSNLSAFNQNLHKILANCLEAVAYLQEDKFIAQLLYFNIGTAFLFQGNIEESMTFFEKCRKASIETGNTYLSIASNQAIARNYISKGQYRKAEHETAALLMQINEKEEITLSIEGLLYAVLAEIKLLQNKPEEAMQMAMEGIKLGSFGEDKWTMGENLLIIARIHKSEGRREEQETVLREIESCVKGRSFFDLEIRLGLFLAGKQMEEGKLVTARQWIYNNEQMLGERFSAIYPEVGLLKAELHGKTERYRQEEEFKACILSRREQDILRLIQQGISNVGIADKLCISVNTVKTHILNIFDKLEVHNRYKAVLLAEQRKLLD